ncbi:MAG: haloacid dehalogenase-like hydrolase [Solobacterium sp.]|nr:haloacid dehalogenase-like hydrolase [Solobacterium sp.]
MKKAALVYDFDKTLCDRDMQEYSLIPDLGYGEPGQFWAEVDHTAKENRMDGISAYLFVLMKKFREAGNPLTKDHFRGLGAKIALNPGVETWFKRINEYGANCGLEVEHYIISSGMEEILEGTTIAQQFRKIYACRYYYNEEGHAEWPALIVNYTTKTQYLFRINKQVLDESNERDLNTWVPMQERAVPFERMIYIADGLTDVPCMKLVKMNGGRSIAVYHPNSAKAGLTAQRLLSEKRADFMAPSDYSEGKELEQLVKMILDEMSSRARLQDLEGVVR